MMHSLVTWTMCQNAHVPHICRSLTHKMLPQSRSFFSCSSCSTTFLQTPCLVLSSAVSKALHSMFWITLKEAYLFAQLLWAWQAYSGPQGCLSHFFPSCLLRPLKRRLRSLWQRFITWSVMQGSWSIVHLWTKLAQLCWMLVFSMWAGWRRPCTQQAKSTGLGLRAPGCWIPRSGVPLPGSAASRSCLWHRLPGISRSASATSASHCEAATRRRCRTAGETSRLQWLRHQVASSGGP
mmetsp:Transcript_107409/g.206569  ORF Transcript_107409/g.206569 Transcript_107409/m.206569 type:complete len:237 (-) Transcript_107409:767-1477(-)